MRITNRSQLGIGFIGGLATLSIVGAMMGQGSTQPPRDPNQPSTTGTPAHRDSSQPAATHPDREMYRTEYFVTGDANRASLWTRDGTALRWVSSATASGADQKADPDKTTAPTYKPSSK